MKKLLFSLICTLFFYGLHAQFATNSNMVEFGLGTALFGNNTDAEREAQVKNGIAFHLRYSKFNQRRWGWGLSASADIAKTDFRDTDGDGARWETYTFLAEIRHQIPIRESFAITIGLGLGWARTNFPSTFSFSVIESNNLVYSPQSDLAYGSDFGLLWKVTESVGVSFNFNTSNSLVKYPYIFLPTEGREVKPLGAEEPIFSNFTVGIFKVFGSKE